MTAGQDGAADHRRGKGQDQPIVADRGLPQLQPCDQHDPGHRRQDARQGMCLDDGRHDRNAGKIGCMGIAPDRENVAPRPLSSEEIGEESNRCCHRQDEPGKRPGDHGVAERFDAFRHAIKGLCSGDPKIDAFKDRQARKRDDKGRNASPRNRVAIGDSADKADQKRQNCRQPW